MQKVAECLYRYSSNGVYYARIKTTSKEIRRSLRTTDPVLAKRNLRVLKEEQAHVDPARGRCSLAELCKRPVVLMRLNHLRADAKVG